jgi:hypothetical protein
LVKSIAGTHVRVFTDLFSWGFYRQQFSKLRLFAPSSSDPVTIHITTAITSYCDTARLLHNLSWFVVRWASADRTARHVITIRPVNVRTYSITIIKAMLDLRASHGSSTVRGRRPLRPVRTLHKTLFGASSKINYWIRPYGQGACMC